MTTWTELHPDEATLISRVWRKEPGTYNVTVPANAKFVRASAIGCGGQGDHWGGSGAGVRTRAAVNAGDNLIIQVGDTSTAAVVGDSFVKYNDGTVICYADRGRGNGNAGQAALSVGDVRRDGAPGVSGVGGSPTSDASEYGSMGFGGTGSNNHAQDSSSTLLAADYGGGGYQVAAYDVNGDFMGYTAFPAGTGLVVLEFFDSNPGY
jgi:hypothetical protein